jgi:alpha-L-fucosidase
MHSARIPVERYEALASRFMPVKFDADEWVRIAEMAGMKYIVITSKHHDGFCLFDSAHTTWDVMDATPFRRDIMKELSMACASRGLRMCWYHSIMDWHHPDYLPRRAWDARPAEGADFGRYVEYVRAQVTELLTKYGPVGVMWFDGEWEETWNEAHGKALYELCRRLQPDVIVNNRVGKGRAGMAGLTREGKFAGDFGTPEQEVPGSGLPGVDWESCMTMNDTWGYKDHDRNWKSSDELIRTLIDIASKGGNFLLNVGPTAEGEIPATSVERLEAMGKWLEANGESIYGTSAGPFARLKWGRCTSRAGKLYLHVFDWPEDGRLIVPGLLNEVRGARLLDSGDTLTVESDAAGAAIRVPARAPRAAATVIVLDIAGEPAVVEMPIVPDSAGVVSLRAIDAAVQGTTARYEGGADHQNIGFWTDAEDTVRWEVMTPPGRYTVEVTYACDPTTAGATYRVRIGDRSIQGRVESTGSWTTWRTASLGVIELLGGPATCVVEPVTKPGFAVMNLRSLRLAPHSP